MNLRLTKSQKLKNSSEIAQLFERNNLIKEHPFLLYFLLIESNDGPVQIAFGNKRSKLKNSVKRNRTKRIMREAFRMLQSELDQSRITKGKKLALMLIHTGEKLPDLAYSKEKIKLLLNRLNEELNHLTNE